MKAFYLILLISVNWIFAQEFKTTKAKEAQENYIQEKQKLDDMREKAKEKYEKDLIAARDIAMKAGNLKEAVLINSELEKIGSIDAKNVDKNLIEKDDENKNSESKLKGKVNSIVDEHKGRAAAGINENNSYQFSIEPKSKKYTLKITFSREQKSKGEIYLTDSTQKIINVGKIEPNNEKVFTLDISNYIKSKGTYTFTMNYKEGCCEILIDKMEIIYE